MHSNRLRCRGCRGRHGLFDLRQQAICDNPGADSIGMNDIAIGLLTILYGMPKRVAELYRLNPHLAQQLNKGRVSRLNSAVKLNVFQMQRDDNPCT